jgi:hypothetical protein
MYKGIRKRKRENLQDIKAQLDVKISPCQELIACSKSMGCVHTYQTIIVIVQRIMVIEGWGS